MNKSKIQFLLLLLTLLPETFLLVISVIALIASLFAGPIAFVSYLVSFGLVLILITWLYSYAYHFFGGESNLWKNNVLIALSMLYLIFVLFIRIGGGAYLWQTILAVLEIVLIFIAVNNPKVRM